MVYRVQVTLRGGQRLAGVGFFKDTAEAVDQTWADYPEAWSVTAICLGRGSRA